MKTEVGTQRFLEEAPGLFPQISGCAISVATCSRKGNTRNYRCYPISGFANLPLDKKKAIFEDMGRDLGMAAFHSIDVGPMEKGYNYVLIKLALDTADGMHGSEYIITHHEATGAQAKILKSDTTS